MARCDVRELPTARSRRRREELNGFPLLAHAGDAEVPLVDGGDGGEPLAVVDHRQKPIPSRELDRQWGKAELMAIEPENIRKSRVFDEPSPPERD